MKIKTLLLAAVALVAIAFVVPATTVQASPATVSLSVPLLAQIAAPAPAVVSPSTVVATAPWYQSLLTGENIAWVFGLVSGIVAIFKNKALTTSQKSLRAVIVGVEQATQLPAVQAEAKKIKASIQSYAVSHGIQNELDTLVQTITAQLPVVSAPAAPPTVNGSPATAPAAPAA